MSEEQDKPGSEQPETEREGPRGGERLAEARREQQISVLEVAKELHLDEAKVRALERNEFEVLGAPVFAKGHLRKYSQLVGVDADDVFADYYQMTRSEGVPPVIAIGRSKSQTELSPGPWVAVIVVIIVVAASYWWFAVQSETQLPPATGNEEIAAPEQNVEPAPTVEQSVVESEPIVDVDDAQTPIVSEPQPELAEPEPEPFQTADGETRVTLSYSGDCWTEISDATGRRLFFDMGRSGRTVELTGRAPFAVLFGNVENVSVRLNGNDYPVSPSNPGSRTARLTIMNP